MPSGVRIASALDSGMEWVTLMDSTSNGPTLKRLPGVTGVIGTTSAPGSLASFAMSRSAVKAVA